MMVGERNHSNPTVHGPHWINPDDPTANFFSVALNTNATFNADDFSLHLSPDALTALRRYLPSNSNDADFDADVSGKDLDLPLDAYTCDHFRMFEFKVRKCSHGRSHDWTECPFAHPGEKARRRDPRKYHYSGTACPDFRRGNCKRGDACEFAHGVFECWLHPARYRTEPCKDGLNCRRRVCFFAHAPEQLRVLSPRAESYDGSPHRLVFEGSTVKGLAFMSSPGSSSPPSESPPMSPIATNSLSRSLGSNSINEMVASLHQLHVNKVKSMPPSWGVQVGSPGCGSPRVSRIRRVFCSIPSTPTRASTDSGIGIGQFDLWESDKREEEPVMERVESGRDLRTKMFEKLSKENPLYRGESDTSDVPNPDVDWVSELIR